MNNYEVHMHNYINTILLRKLENKHINFMFLSDHPDLTLDVIKRYPNANWDWECLQNHPNMTLEWLISFPDANWVWQMMHSVRKFEPYWLCLFKHKNWNWGFIHNYKKFDFSWIDYAPDAPWNWDKLSEIVTIEILKKYPNYPWHWDIVTAYSPIEAKDIMKNLNFPWDVSRIRFDEITFDEIPFLRHFKNKFDNDAWSDFTYHTRWNVLKANSDLDWDPHEFNFSYDNFHPSDIRFIRRYTNLNWPKLSYNVPYYIIKNNDDLPWMYEYVSLNPTLSFIDVENAPDKDWDYSVVPCEHKITAFKRWVSASKIKRAWRRAISDPEFLMCRRRIFCEYEELKC